MRGVVTPECFKAWVIETVLEVAAEGEKGRERPTA